DLPFPAESREGGDVDLLLARLVREVCEPPSIRREPGPLVTERPLEQGPRRGAFLEWIEPDFRYAGAHLLEDEQLAIGRERLCVGIVLVRGQTLFQAAAVGLANVQVVCASFLARRENDAFAVGRPDRPAVVLAEGEACQAVAREVEHPDVVGL